MRRILMIGQMSIVGGQQSFMMNYFNKLDKNQFQVDFLGVHGHTSPYQETIEKNGGHLYYWNKTFGFSELIPSLIALVNFIKSGNYDVVHSNIYLGNCWFIVAAKLAGVKIRISHSHCTFPLAEKGENILMKLYHSVFQKYLLIFNSTHLFACGEEAGRALYGKRPFVIMKNGININNYIDISRNAILGIKKEFSIGDGTKVFASISRFDSNKNLLYAVKVFQEIYKTNTNSILILGGAEPYDLSTHQEISKFVDENNLQEVVHIVGTRSDLPVIMQVVDCWLFPSFHEGLPIVGIELQAASVNVLASDTITKEMDMGLNLVNYISLNDFASWCSYAKSATHNILPTEKIRDALSERGYNLEDCVKELERYYLC